MSFTHKLRVLYPKNKIPVSLIIDDPTPIINPLYYHWHQVDSSKPEYYKETKEIPIDFIERVANVLSNAKGKFSIIPYPAGLGPIDHGLKGYSKKEVKKWLSVVKEKIAPNFDITPEMLTHTLALNLEDETLLKISEQEWSRTQTAETLTPYIAKALRILKNVGFTTNGVTSPGNFGAKVEPEYAKAVLEAVKQVYGNKLAWYFLHVDPHSNYITPALAYFNRYKGEATVSIISSNEDRLWQTMDKKKWNQKLAKETLDYYITENGKEGRIAQLIKENSPAVFHTHWNSLYSNGEETGLNLLQEILTRINQNLSDRIIWMKCSELAEYYAASQTLRITTKKEPNKTIYLLDTPFQAKNFTISLKIENIKSITIGEAQIREGYAGIRWSYKEKTELQKSDKLETNTWIQKAKKAILCINLKPKTCLVVYT